MHYDRIVSRNVEFYADRVLRDLDVAAPPVQVDDVLEYFGLDLIKLSDQDMGKLGAPSAPKLHVPAFLVTAEDLSAIFVKESDGNERQRLSIFHECGHFDIPWHEQHCFACDCPEVPAVVDAGWEKEAFTYAARLMFPNRCFCKDIQSYAVSLFTIQHLAFVYQASFEATAIHYINMHPEPCAIMYLNIQPGVVKGHPLSVRYSVKSPSFHRYWKPGEPIKHHELFREAVSRDREAYGLIPAAVFGSKKKHKYMAEVRPYGHKQICVLLKVDNPQGRMF